MRVALLQYGIGETKEKTLEIIRRLVTTVFNEKPDLIVLPELCLTGYGNGPPDIASEQNGSDVKALQTLAVENNTTIVAGLAVTIDDHYRNRALIIDSSGVVAYYDKKQLFPIWKEADWFTAGTGPVTFSVVDWKVGINICYDLRFPELFREIAGVPLMIVIANWPASRRDHWRTLLKARAIENQAYVVGVNRIGEGNGVAFCGDSMAFNYRGELLADLEDRQAAACVNIELEPLERFRKKFPFLP